MSEKKRYWHKPKKTLSIEMQRYFHKSRLSLTEFIHCLFVISTSNIQSK